MKIIQKCYRVPITSKTFCIQTIHTIKNFELSCKMLKPFNESLCVVCVTHWSLALLQVLTPDLWKGHLHELQQVTVVSLQAAGRTIKLEEHQSF